MKSLMILGGLMGFGMGLLFNWAEQGAWPSCLWHACVAAYVACMLMRWWGNAWRKSLEASLNEQHESITTQTTGSPLSKAIKS